MIVATSITDKEIECSLLEIIFKIKSDKFLISSRSKNELFKRRYSFTKRSHYKNILMTLKKNHLDKIGEEDQPEIYGEGKIFVFIKQCELINIHGEKEDVRLYIKIKIPKDKEVLPIISFHVCEY